MDTPSASVAHPRRFYALVTLFLALLLGVAVPIASAGTGDPAPSNLGTDIRKYMTQPGDRVVVVPDGTYTAGDVYAPHAATNGTYGGRLILVAQTRGKVVVDLSKAPLHFLPGTSRVSFVGFRFVNGTIDNERATDMTFWYTDHTYPVETWYAEYKAKGGDLSKMVHRTPTTVRLRGGSNLRFYGSDLHDIGDDAFSGYNIGGLLLQGVRIWNVSEKTYDPSDLFHNDAIGTTGGLNALTVRDTYLGQRLYIGAENSAQSNLTYENVWSTRSSSAGVVFYSQRGNKVTGSRTNIRSWGHLGRGGVDRVDEFADGTQCIGTKVNCRSDIQVADKNIVRTAPTSSDVDPAVAWRNSHGYDSWRMGGSSPSTTSTTSTTAPPSTTTTTAPAPTSATYTLFGSAKPTLAAAGETRSIEVGVKIRSDVAGSITALRFFKASTNTGTHVGRIWDATTGNLLANATFTNETASGWQTVTLSSPVTVKAGATYIASYTAPRGRFSKDVGYFAGSSVDRGPLHAPASAKVGGNGVYSYGAGVLPATTNGDANYWVDVVLRTS